MKYAYIGIRTLTDAERGLRLLRGGNIPAQLGRLPLHGESGGCTHALRLPARDAKRAERILLAAGIRVGKTVIAEEETRPRKHRHDLPR